MTAGVVLISFIAALEATVVATAMPTIVGDLGGFKLYAWVMTAYLLTMTVSGPIWGKLSDLYGRREVYMASVVVFLTGSALSGQAHSMQELIGWRLLQGMGGGALTAIGQTIMAEIYTLEKRAQMQALLTSVFGVASVAGPLVGGALAQHASWRWVFYLNVPFGIAGATCIAISLPRRPPAANRPRLDWLGAATFTLGFSLLMVWLQFSPEWGFTQPQSLGLLAGAVVVLVAFLGIERDAPEPLVPMHVFRHRLVRAAVVEMVLVGMCMFGVLGFVPLLMQGVLGTTATRAGQAITPLLLGWVFMAPIGTRMVVGMGYRVTTLIGTSSAVLSYWMLQGVRPSTPVWQVMLACLLTGVAAGFCFAPLLIGAQSVVEKQVLGAVTSAVLFFRSIGGAVGAAVWGAAVSSATGHLSSQQMLGSPGLALGLSRAFGLGLGVAGLALLCLVLIPPGSARALEEQAEAQRSHN